MSSIGKVFAYELQLFDRFCASQKVTKIGRTIHLVLDAVSPRYLLWYHKIDVCRECMKISCHCKFSAHIINQIQCPVLHILKPIPTSFLAKMDGPARLGPKKMTNCNKSVFPWLFDILADRFGMCVLPLVIMQRMYRCDQTQWTHAWLCTLTSHFFLFEVFIHNKNIKYIVAYQRGGVSINLPDL